MNLDLCPVTLGCLQISRAQVSGEPDAKLEDNSGAKDSELSDEKLHDKEAAIRFEYADWQFHMFDVESFFQELHSQGRKTGSFS